MSKKDELYMNSRKFKFYYEDIYEKRIYNREIKVVYRSVSSKLKFSITVKRFHFSVP